MGEDSDKVEMANSSTINVSMDEASYGSYYFFSNSDLSQVGETAPLYRKILLGCHAMIHDPCVSERKQKSDALLVGEKVFSNTEIQVKPSSDNKTLASNLTGDKSFSTDDDPSIMEDDDLESFTEDGTETREADAETQSKASETPTSELNQEDGEKKESEEMEEKDAAKEEEDAAEETPSETRCEDEADRRGSTSDLGRDETTNGVNVDQVEQEENVNGVESENDNDEAAAQCSETEVEATQKAKKRKSFSTKVKSFLRGKKKDVVS